MSLKIRLARHGRSGAPFYWLVLAESTSRRDGKYIAKLGTYNPLSANGPKLQIMDESGIKKYLSCGAKPTPTVVRLLKSINFHG